MVRFCSGWFRFFFLYDCDYGVDGLGCFLKFDFCGGVVRVFFGVWVLVVRRGFGAGSVVCCGCCRLVECLVFLIFMEGVKVVWCC